MGYEWGLDRIDYWGISAMKIDRQDIQHRKQFSWTTNNIPLPLMEYKPIMILGNHGILMVAHSD